MLKVGLIGCGFMGTMHANCWKALSDRAEVVAVADVRPEKAEELAALFGAKIYSDGKDLIENEKLDVVDICLPTYLHEKYAVMAMKADANVFVEKPMCRTKEEAENLVKVQKETGKLLQVGQVIRFWDEYVWLKKVIDEGKYGKLTSATFKRMSPRPTWGWENWLHTPEKSGGMALDLHVHDIDYIRYILGEPKKIQVVGNEHADGLNEYIMSTYIYDDNVIATAEGAWNFPENFRFSMSFCVRFEKATVCHDSGIGEFVVYLENGEKEVPVIEKQFEGSAGSGNISSLGGYYNELRYFTDLIADPTLPQIASVTEGARSVELALDGIAMAKGNK